MKAGFHWNLISPLLLAQRGLAISLVQDGHGVWLLGRFILVKVGVTCRLSMCVA